MNQKPLSSMHCRVSQSILTYETSSLCLKLVVDLTKTIQFFICDSDKCVINRRDIYSFCIRSKGFDKICKCSHLSHNLIQNFHKIELLRLFIPKKSCEFNYHSPYIIYIACETEFIIYGIMGYEVFIIALVIFEPFKCPSVVFLFAMNWINTTVMHKWKYPLKSHDNYYFQMWALMPQYRWTVPHTWLSQIFTQTSL